MDCLMCHTYVHDTISRPFKCDGINPERALRYCHNLLSSELVRIARGQGEGDPDFLAIIFVESGGVKRSCLTGNPLPLAHTWIQYQLRQIGDIYQIHSEHTPPIQRVKVPVQTQADGSPALLRIRIPEPRYDDLYA